MSRAEDRIRAAFDRAQEIEIPLVKSVPTEKEAVRRTTSAAKEFDPDGQVHASDDLSEAFERANDNRVGADVPVRRESEMVKSDAPEMHLRPDDARTKEAGAREAHSEALSKEDREARGMAESLRQQQRERSSDGPDRDFDR